ncbi:MAG TPA: DUF6111 family protein [Acetobacteraceae bacterium]|jgi:hypothetical protein
MLRLAELLLFLAPFALFLLWRVAAPLRGPSPRLVALAAATLALVFLALLWYRTEDSMRPHADYVPPTYRNGRIVPGHAAPP